MMRPRTLVFDCDGVILDSNQLKTEAFRKVAQPFGDEAAEALVRYHIEQGGFSRYKKFSFFLEKILGREVDNKEVDDLSRQFGECVLDGLMNCQLTQSLEELRNDTADSLWMVVSGGDEAELNTVFSRRNIAHYFDGGIFGSPDNKDIILHRELSSCYPAKHPALFLGDSRYDHEASRRAGCEFVFVSAWTDFIGWEKYCQENRLPTIEKLENLIGLFSSEI